MSNISISGETSNQFKTTITPMYDFLEDCSTCIKKCSILKDLDFDGGDLELVEKNINTLKEDVDNLVKVIYDYGDNVLEKDQVYSDILMNIRIDDKTTQASNKIVNDETTQIIDKPTNNETKEVSNKPLNDETTPVPNKSVNNASEQVSNKTANNETKEVSNRPINRGGTTISVIPTNNVQNTQTQRYNATNYIKYLSEKFQINDLKKQEELYKFISMYCDEYYNIYKKNPLISLNELEVLDGVCKKIIQFNENGIYNGLYLFLKTLIDTRKKSIN